MNELRLDCNTGEYLTASGRNLGDYIEFISMDEKEKDGNDTLVKIKVVFSNTHNENNTEEFWLRISCWTLEVFDRFVHNTSILSSYLLDNEKMYRTMINRYVAGPLFIKRYIEPKTHVEHEIT